MGMSSRRVLIVDDEEIIADTLRLIFLRDGYEVRAAYSAELAAAVVKEWLPDLAVLDVVLPGMSGVEFAILLGELSPGCRVVLFSGQVATGLLLANAEALGHSFVVLAKPVHPAEMLATARRLLPAD